MSKYFTLHDMLYLPRWDRIANERDGLTPQIKQNCYRTAAHMDMVREFFGLPIIVHCWYRPLAYNKLIGGAEHSAHMEGLAVDFHVKGLSCDYARSKILKEGMLEKWGMRMEDKPGSDWIHLDLKDPGEGKRFFRP